MATDEKKRLAFDQDICMISKTGLSIPGRLRFGDAGLAFKPKSSELMHFYKDDMVSVDIFRVARGCRIRFTLKTDSMPTFEGFTEEDVEYKIKPFMSTYYNIPIQSHKTSVKGWTSGRTEFSAKHFRFVLDDGVAFEVPLASLTAAQQQRHEAILEFQIDDMAEVNDQVVESMRFFVPGAAASSGSGANSNYAAATEFVSEINERTAVNRISGKAICMIENVKLVVPRGTHDVEFYSSFLRLHGKKFDHKIQYENVQRMHLLTQDDKFVFFVLTLREPLRQGNMRYSYVVMQFSSGIEMSVTLSLETDEARQALPDFEDQQELRDEEALLFGRLLSAACKKDNYEIATAFTSSRSFHAVPCTLKANEGFLFPTNRALFFLHKPVTYIPYSQIAEATFERGSTARRGIDLTVKLKSGEEHEFRSVPKEDQHSLLTFLQNKNVRTEAPISDEPKKVSYVEASEGSGSDESDGEFDLEQAEQQQEEEDEMNSEDSDSLESELEDEEAELFTKKRRGSDDAAGSDDGGDDDDDEDDFIDDGESKPRRKASKKSSKGASKSQKKDPNRPKKPLRSYMRWFSANREQIKQDNPDASNTELSQIGGQRWKEVSQEDKDKLEEDFQSELAEWETAVAAYDEAHPAADDDDEGASGRKKSKSKSKRRSSKAKADPNAPSKPKSAYLWFFHANREEIKEQNPGLSTTEIAQKAGEMWREMEDKSEYESKAAEDKKRYNKEMESYEPPEEDDDNDGGKASKKGGRSAPPKKAKVNDNYKSAEIISSSSDEMED